jgi:hypothetical protein
MIVELFVLAGTENSDDVATTKMGPRPVQLGEKQRAMT